CLVCENGLNPVVMIFAREVSDPLVRLLGKIDAATAKHRESSLGSFVVFLKSSDKTSDWHAICASTSGFEWDNPGGVRWRVDSCPQAFGTWSSRYCRRTNPSEPKAGGRVS